MSEGHWEECESCLGTGRDESHEGDGLGRCIRCNHGSVWIVDSIDDDEGFDVEFEW